jgi:hypothetical protein
MAAIALVLCSSVGAASATSTRGAIGRQALSRYGAAQRANAAAAALVKARFGIPNGTSGNWSGYVDKNYKSTGTFTSVAATWNVPAVAASPNDCSAGTFATGEGLAGFWVGLDGSGDGTVEQTGTAVECYKGSASYWDWYEMYPNPPVVLGSVNPGDEISASVAFSGGTYFVTIKDITSGASNSEWNPCPTGSTCLNHSAEVIAEAPGGCAESPGQTCRVTPHHSFYLTPDFQWVRFRHVSVATKTSSGGIGASSFGPLDLTMVNSASIKLAVVSTTVHNDAFTDSWRASG